MSPQSNPEFVRVGQIVATYGTKGGMRVALLTDFLDRFESGRIVFVRGNRHRVISATVFKGQLRLALSGVTTMEGAEAHKWAYIEVPGDARPTLSKDEFMTNDLIGLRAVDPHGRALGKVADVITSPAHDLLVIRSAMVPAVKQFVKRVDLSKGEIVIDPIPGMFEEDDQ